MNSKVTNFQQLHESGCFVMPNPWDIGTAKVLERLGFQALATTSAGFAFSQGLPDAEDAVPLDKMLEHIEEIVRATSLPVNADFEAGYALSPDDVARNVQLCAQTGVGGLSIEDNNYKADKSLFELSLATDRIAAAALALKETGVVLTARCEAHLLGLPDAQTIALERVKAYNEAGADVIFVPGLHHKDDIAAVIAAASPRPVNLILAEPQAISVQEAANLGVRRISVGSSFARAAWGGFMAVAQEMAEHGTLKNLETAIPFAQMNAMFLKDLRS